MSINVSKMEAYSANRVASHFDYAKKKDESTPFFISIHISVSIGPYVALNMNKNTNHIFNFENHFTDTDVLGLDLGYAMYINT